MRAKQLPQSSDEILNRVRAKQGSFRFHLERCAPHAAGPKTTHVTDARIGYTPYVRGMRDPLAVRGAQRDAPPTVKERNAVQRAVTNLLDLLAPERATTRADRSPIPIEQYRTPSGCVLQAATAALSVSWFADAPTDAGLGELQVVLWRGVVTRRGAGPTREVATVVREYTLQPVVDSVDGAAWRDAADDSLYDIRRLGDHCLALLKEQMLADNPTDNPTENPTDDALPTTPRQPN